MNLGRLLGAIRHRWVRGESGALTAGLEVTDVTHDSRQAGPGVLFVAIRGAKADGMSFAVDAMARGAVAVVSGAGRDAGSGQDQLSRVIEVDDERAALAVLAREVHGRPDERIKVVGVTGTNGKTTTCRILEAILEASGVRPGVLGTVSYRFGGEEVAAGRTTPEASDIHRYLARMVQAGCGACVMEASSHAIDLKRVHGIRFAAAVFTNLTPEHLDYHGDMESYFRAKSGLFAGPSAPAAAVVNTDDSFGLRLDAEIRKNGPGKGPRLTTFGAGPAAMIRLAKLESGASGNRITLEAADGGFVLESPLIGRPNAFNVTAAAATARALGFGWESIAKGVTAAVRVPGRMERIGDQEFTVLVDYAHKEEALRSLLQTVRSITPGRVLIVFGCGGERDRQKRPLMGVHAARLADIVYVTSDNPRGEKPEAIIAEIMTGVESVESAWGGQSSPGRIHVDADRRAAISAAILEARAGDTVVIAGKGHETSQIIGDRVLPFDDRTVAREALARRRGVSSNSGSTS